MVKAVFLDFFGTVVMEDGGEIGEIADIVCRTGKVENKWEVPACWWQEFQALSKESYGENFVAQRTLETEAMRKTVEHFQSNEDPEKLCQMIFDYWDKSPIFDDAKPFLEACPVPVYIVSNIDTADIMRAIKHHELTPAGVITSEDAKAYKPRKEIYELALKIAGLEPSEVLHVGDSLNSDVKGASSVSINTLWLNRFGKEVPEGVTAICSLMDILESEYLK